MLVSVLLIAWLLRKMDFPELWPILQTVDARWLVAGFFVFSPVLLIVSWRWRLLLSVHQVYLGLWRIFELNMIGQLFSAFLLGTTGGDVIKIYYAARAFPQRRTAVAFTVIVDRVIGLVALLLFGTALSLFEWPVLFSHHSTKLFTALFYLFALGGVAGSVVASVGPYLLENRFISAFVDRLPFRERRAKIIGAYDKTARSLSVNVTALLVSIPSHICTTLMGYCVLCGLHLQAQVPFIAFCAMLAIVNMLIALPISISGLGVREGLFIMFFALFNVDKAHAFAFSITYFALNLIWSLVGGPFYFLYRHETHAPPAPHLTEPVPLFSER